MTPLYPLLSILLSKVGITVNLEIFARVLFSRDFAYAKFRENKILAKWRNYSVVLNVANMPFNAILENKILAKNSGFTVLSLDLFIENLQVYMPTWHITKKVMRITYYVYV